MSNRCVTAVLLNAYIPEVSLKHFARSYWIGALSNKVTVGLCHDPYQNEVLSAWIHRSGMLGFQFASVSLSTTSDNSGKWQFALGIILRRFFFPLACLDPAWPSLYFVSRFKF